MKKLYISSIAILLTSSSLADHHIPGTSNNFELNIGGQMYFQAGTRFNSSIYSITQNNKDIGFDSSTAVHLSLKSTLPNNWKYGMQLGIRGNNVSSSKAGSDFLDRNYLWLEHDNVGKFELGSNASASTSMGINGMSVAVASGGADGSWGKYISLDTSALGATGVSEGNFLTFPGLLFNETNFDSTNTHERSRKITYYTPKSNGFQLGISYTPDVTNNGGSSSTPSTSTTATRQEGNGVSLGLTWEKSIDIKQDVSLAFIGERGQIARSTLDKTTNRNFYKSQAFEVGGNYRYDKIHLGASYGYHGKANLEKISGLSDTSFYTLGAQYEITPSTRTSISFLHTEKLKNKLDVAGIGIETDVAKGALAYVDLAHFKAKQTQNYSAVAFNAPGNASITPSIYQSKGTALIFGSQLSF
jgi:predicted porin